jgi:predicted amidohydrolase YtcJ
MIANGDACETDTPATGDTSRGLRMWTSTAAYANYEEHDMGSIIAGKLGDLS